MRQGRDQVRCLPVFALRTADGLAVDLDDHPAAGPRGPGIQPGPGNLAGQADGGQGERAPAGGLLCRAAVRSQRGQYFPAGVGGPLPDHCERPRARGHRRDPDGEQSRQHVPSAAPLPWVRDLGKELEKVLAAGSQHGRRCHRRTASLMAGDGEPREPPSFRPGPSAARGHAGRVIRRYDIAGHDLNSRLCRVPALEPNPLRCRAPDTAKLQNPPAASDRRRRVTKDKAVCLLPLFHEGVSAILVVSTSKEVIDESTDPNHRA